MFIGSPYLIPCLNAKPLVLDVSAEPLPIAFTKAPADEEIALCRFFQEPLIPFSGQPIEGENGALAEGIMLLERNDDFSGLESFLGRYPESRWNVSLLTNLGLLYRQNGFWTKALTAWETAWQLGRNQVQPEQKLLVDRAVAQLGELKARLGRISEVESLIKEVGDRKLNGVGSEIWIGVNSSLSLMREEPAKSFRCGPLAVGKILKAADAFTNERRQLVFDSVSTLRGTSLTQVLVFAKKVGLNYQMAYRTPGSEVISPAVVNWKVGHFAAITARVNNKFIVEDTTFTDTFALSETALDNEATGYFLVRSGNLPEGWRGVTEEEGGKVWGKGATPINPESPPNPPGVKCPDENLGMAGYDMDPSRAALLMYDTPLFYSPPRGPAVQFKASYMQRDLAPSTLPNYPNLGPKWNLNWVSFIIDDPGDYYTKKSYGPGGGTLRYNYRPATSSFDVQLEDQSVLTRTSTTPLRYEKLLADGSRQVFGLTDNSYVKRVFLTEAYDPAGNKTTYTYDTATFRLLSISDALGQVTTLSYLSNSPLLPDNVTVNPEFYKVNSVSDPFGRSALLQYDASGRLWKITDTAGIVSQFFYGGGDFISKLTTPYGDTTFVSVDGAVAGDPSPNNNDRSLLATDPMGSQEFVKFKYNHLPSESFDPSLPSAPDFKATTGYQGYRNSYYWDKKAFAEGAGNYAKAKLFHWLHTSDGISLSNSLEGFKMPLEKRVYYNYPNQNGMAYISDGSSNRPNKSARLLDDGTTQILVTETNNVGNIIKRISPGDATTVSRTTIYQYDATGRDLLGVYQKNAAGLSSVLDPISPYASLPADLLASYTYYPGGKHLLQTAKDASRRVTSYTYNGFGQVLTVTNAKNETTTLVYDRDQDSDGKTDGYLLSITGPATGGLTTFQYDGFGRVWKVTDSEGYTIETIYDAIGGVSTKTLNRPAKIKYPDGSTEEVTYDRLDAQFVKDRLNQWTENQYDPLRRLTATIDAKGSLTHYDWCGCGSLEGITDPSGNHTTWMRDIQGRLTQKVYPDGKITNYIYENTTSRLKYSTDAKAQRTNNIYNIDDTLRQVSYTDTSGGALSPPTPSVAFTYDPIFLRVKTMVDGVGTTTYGYNPVPAAGSGPIVGARRLATVDGPWAADTVSHGYDELGRNLTRQINGASNASSQGYDALGRINTATNPLGAFTYNYVIQTERLDNVINPNGTRSLFVYFPNSGNQRLQKIRHEITAGGGLISQNDYTYAATGRIDSWTQNNSGLTAPKSYQFSYDQANQLTSALLIGGSEQGWQYDGAGNRTGVREGMNLTSYTTNNLNQLTGSSGGGLMRFAGTLSKPATVTVGGNPATVDSSNRYEGFAQVTAGQTTQVHIVATNSQGEITNRYVNITPAIVPAKVFNYDLNGSLLSYGPLGNPEASYAYDAADRLRSVTKGANTWSYEYDGLNRRVREKLNGTELKHWVWDSLEECEERNSSDVVTKRFYSQGFTLNAQPAAGDRYYYTRDHLGSIREVTDNGQTVRARYDYDAFGARTANLITSNPVEADFGYTGHYYDAATGLCAAPFRFYNANLGRWLSRDPIGEEGGINLYGYVANRPITLVDPLGLWTSSVRVNISYFGINVTGSLNFDGHGGIGVTASGGGGFTPGGSITIGAAFTDADSICELEGNSSTTGIGFGEGPVGEVNKISGDGYTGLDFGVGVGFGSPIAPQYFSGITGPNDPKW